MWGLCVFTRQFLDLLDLDHQYCVLSDQIVKNSLADVFYVLQLVELGVEEVEDGAGVEELGFA